MRRNITTEKSQYKRLKKTTQSLKNSKSTGPELRKNEFIKYGGNKPLEKPTSFFNEIFNREQIPQ